MSPLYEPFIAAHVQHSSFVPRSFTAAEADKARAVAAAPCSKAAVPSKREVMASIPAHCFEKSTAKSLAYACGSLFLTVLCGVAGARIPAALAALSAMGLATGLTAWVAPILLWTSYAVVTGTVATGCWVVAHECGHNAFSDNRALQTAVGYVLHSLLLVPYFSWARTHAVHHQHTNHMTLGETHVPMVVGSAAAEETLAARRNLGRRGFGAANLVG